MANVFNKIADIKNDVKRNSFDWSHDNNFTTDLGRITPVFTELVPPNSSVRIKPEFGLRFMPMMFPIQTKMKAYLSFFKVPLRTLWSDYMDFISADNTEEYQPPFIKFSASDFKQYGCLTPSGLCDYFGIPVPSVVVPTEEGPALGFTGTFTPSSRFDNTGRYVFSVDDVPYPTADNTIIPRAVLSDVSFMRGSFPGELTNPSGCVTGVNIENTQSASDFVYVKIGDLKFSSVIEIPDNSHPLRCSFTISFETPNYDSLTTITNFLNNCRSLYLALGPTGLPYSPTVTSHYTPLSLGRVLTTTKKSSTISVTFAVDITSDLLPSSSGVENSYDVSLVFPAFSEFDNRTSGAFTAAFSSITGTLDTYRYYGAGRAAYYSDLNTSSDSIKVSAYPFRAYEAIYNAYIRNTRNNPFVLNGKKTYNKWITTDAGGVDTLTPKDLLYANWQSDAYTTALQAPQQGTAPLVGLTTYETRTINDAGHEVTTINTAIVDEDGNAYKVDFESNGEALKGVSYTPLKAGELVNPQALVSPVTSGISINDFRNVNAYQRYLELNQFRGFSYKEIIEGRFDVNVRYDALNMPEYLGGITRDIVVNPITQTVETSNQGTYVGALGSQAGLATCFGNSDGSISVFCDEESIIMGIMYVMPMPVYDSVLPKWLTYRERLDSFNPEFDHIGYQPIYVKELAPLQAAATEVSFDTVFGYQRPWYEYVQKPDRAHGLFLSSLRNFIMFRSFSDVPELGKEFTVMQPGSVNDVFTVTEVSDKILGQIHFDCTAQLPISRVVVPRLE